MCGVAARLFLGEGCRYTQTSLLVWSVCTSAHHPFFTRAKKDILDEVSVYLSI